MSTNQQEGAGASDIANRIACRLVANDDIALDEGRAYVLSMLAPLESALTTARQEVETWMTRCIHAEKALDFNTRTLADFGKEVATLRQQLAAAEGRIEGLRAALGGTALRIENIADLYGEDSPNTRGFLAQIAADARTARDAARSAHPSKEDEEEKA